MNRSNWKEQGGKSNRSKQRFNCLLVVEEDGGGGEGSEGDWWGADVEVRRATWQASQPACFSNSKEDREGKRINSRSIQFIQHQL